MTVTKTSEVLPWHKRQDVWLWISGLIFIAVLIALIQGVGFARGWNARSGYTYNESKTTMERFLPEPYQVEEGVRGRSSNHSVGNWYYWQTKPNQRTFWTHFFPWIGYILHQTLIWSTIYRAQMEKAQQALGPSRYSSTVQRTNWIALVLNAFFHLLHFVNTHTTYDALAPDVQLFSPLTAVVLFLILIIVMEYKERGLFFGWPLPKHKDRFSTKLRLDYGPTNLVRRYHGYIFSWAVIFTFWYHPMENTVGHSLGFIYTWIMLLQGSLMYTNFHLNKYWRLVQEIWVITHGAAVAYESGLGHPKGILAWPMFVFGFLVVFVLTQLFGLPFWTRLPVWTRFLPLILFLVPTIWCYSWILDINGKPWIRLPEVLRIPAVYYAIFLIVWAFLYFLIWLNTKIGVGTGSLNIWKAGKRPSLAKRLACMSSAFFTAVIAVGMSIMFQFIDWSNQFVVMLSAFSLVFIVLSCVAFMFLKVIIPSKITCEKGDKEMQTAPVEVEPEKKVQELDVKKLPSTDGKMSYAL